jgi:hypothetical protein
LGEEAAEGVLQAADAAVAAAVPANANKRGNLSEAEAAADAWKQKYWDLYQRRHEQPAPLPDEFRPLAEFADKQHAGTAQGVTAGLLAAAVSAEEAMTGQQPGPVSLVACWFPVQVK